MNYSFLPHASQELEDATLYYSNLDTSLGGSFRAEIERVIGLILKLPNAWPLITNTARRCRTRRFPYAVVYRDRENEIQILAVMHVSRPPRYWLDRTG
jgi:plasmid stabilization system protein ParE